MHNKKYIIGKVYILRDVDDSGNDIKGKLVEIDREGYHVFKVTSKASELEEFTTKVPDENVFIK